MSTKVYCFSFASFILVSFMSKEKTPLSEEEWGEEEDWEEWEEEEWDEAWEDEEWEEE